MFIQSTDEEYSIQYALTQIAVDRFCNVVGRRVQTYFRSCNSKSNSRINK